MTTDPAPPLSVRNLRVAGDRGRQILAVDALEVAPGESLGIRGPSGAGKSTLLHALAGLLPVSGEVRWGDTDLATLSGAARAAFRARTIGMIFQDFLLFDEMDPVANAGVTALFAPRVERAARRARARDLLRALGVPGEARSVASFSGGERQRVSVARALAAGAPVLLADEPTASLHRKAADALIDDLLAEVAAGRTLIVASHDEHLLSALSRVVELRDGVLPGEGGGHA